MKFVVEQYPDTFVAYPLSLKGVVIGEGETRELALADAHSAAKFHVETFGKEALQDEVEPIKAEVVEFGD